MGLILIVTSNTLFHTDWKLKYCRGGMEPTCKRRHAFESLAEGGSNMA